MAKRQIHDEVPELRSVTSTADTTQQPPIPVVAPGITLELEQQIRALAFQLYEQRGRQDGHAEDDWIQAESIILGRKEKLAA